MKIEQANRVFGHKITGGSEYCWRCWPDARYMDYENDHAHGSVVFSTVDQTVFEATVTSKDEDVAPYRWLNPATKDRMIDESKVRGIDHDIAWDDVRWVDCELWDDWAEKAETILAGQVPDTRVQVPVELSDSEFLQLAMEAHKQDITLNQLITNILQAEIEAHDALVAAENGRELRREIRSLTPVAADTDDRSTSDIEHSHYYYDYSRNGRNR